ncbi:nitroreductase family deazaflavin-dependent oxidoreductase [Pseudactinotalea suaedae]|uniref:nitroreductase family deazaflavin-dependent oxidoreductase n=1 Tax=Pseudactinotalea suaedae TaxID=1524924 RepID=UPI0012E19507|nr:nitroreductase family deazaflavin-dependent oxidoreductase [Pseudactinotalea suaedae]
MAGSSRATIVRAALAVVAVAALALVVTVVVGLRTRNRAVLRAMHRIQRDRINPRVLESAGRPGAPYAIVRHTGRVSGRSYETPVGAVVTEEGVAITLPYGTEPDWVRNVLAAGRATIVVEGDEREVTDPAVLPLGETALASTSGPLATLLGVTSALVLRFADGGAEA